MRRIIQPEQAINQIRRKGDVFDADRQRNKKIATLPNGVLAGSTLLPHFITYGATVSPETWLGTLPLIPAAFGAAALSNAIIRRRKMSQAGTALETLRHTTGEPIDLIRTSSRDHHQLKLRWYGLDGKTQSQAAGTVMSDRIQRVADFAEHHDFSTITVGADLVSGYETVDGMTYATDIKHSPWVQLEDLLSDENVAELTIAELRALPEKLTLNVNHTLRDAIIARLNDSYMSTWNEHAENPEQRKLALIKLKQAVTLAIERETDEVEVVREVLDDGSPTVTRRFVSKRISGDTVSSIGQSKHPVSGHDRVEYYHDGNVAGLAGYTTGEALITDLMREGAIEQAGKLTLLAGLYELLQVEDIPRTPTKGHANSTGTDIVPLYERLQRDAPRREVDQSIYKQNSVYRRLAALAFLTTAGLVGMVAGVETENAGYDAYKRNDARYIAYASDHLKPEESIELVTVTGDKDSSRYRKFLKQSDGFGERLDRAIFNGYMDVEPIDSSIAVRTAQLLIETFHIDGLGSMSDSYESEQKIKWLDRLSPQAKALEAAPELYSSLEDQSFIGDVPSKSNLPLFAIRSISGESSSGYWYTATSDRIAVNEFAQGSFGPQSIYFDNGINPLSKIIESKRFDTVPADFEIETKHVAYYGDYDHDNITQGPMGMHLPVKAGYKVVAARYIDKADRSNTMPARVSTNAEGLYFLLRPDEEFEKARMADPYLQYKIASAPDGMPQAKEPLDAYMGLRGLTDHERSYISTTVRRALKLSSSATDEEVLRAIRKSKEYSYTPLQREGLTEISAEPGDDKEVIAAVGQAVAQLDTLNCNLASLTYLLGTVDSPRDYNLGTGYHEDGDGIIAQQESHAWVYDDQGAVIDPTPIKMAPGEVPRTAITKEQHVGNSNDEQRSSLSFLLGAEIFLGAAVTVAVWRRRLQIKELTDKGRAAVTLSPPFMQQEVARVKHELYARPGATFTSNNVQRASVDEAAKDYSRNIPTKPSATEGHALNRIKRAIIRMNDPAIRRQASKSVSEG